jgi:hypothetical protein
VIAATCQAADSPSNFAINSSLYNFSGFSSFLALSHIPFNISVWLRFVALCQAVCSLLSVANKNLIFNSVVRSSLAHFHSFNSSFILHSLPTWCQVVLSLQSLPKNNFF